MSNETKQDVFDEVRYKFRNFKNEHRHGMHVSPDSVDHYLSDALKRYYAALPDDLPVIPECVSKEIRDSYGKNSLLDELAWANQDALPSSEVSKWINNNESIFAEAWSRGLWIVEETGKVTSYDK
ncbi:hypothetical protein LacP0543_14640 [Lactobacillus paracasei subsp. tolerans]|uniref:hypothetical protein n=1 Tax=Lacticaseibacillus paracasei TaxID=1597 RepID=UPI00188B5666|nr:hypothetical protein [Lacticaseibacillus paracasei]MBF4176011.1 hypothetical protein [Lacticaseibacillus paracasei subsp. tolerans]